MLKRIRNLVLKIWNYLKGYPDEFSLQSRIYNSVCVVTILVFLYNVPLSILMGGFQDSIPFLILLPVQIYLYYLSRYRNKTVISFIVYAVLINVFFAINYFRNGGVHGSTLLSFCIAYFLIIAVVPRKQYWIWTLFNITLVSALMFYEYAHPESVIHKYGSRATGFIDEGSTYIINIILLFACLSYIINNYAIEKQIAEDNTRKLKVLNSEKNKLISIISHDFSSPLTNVQNYLRILEKTNLQPHDRRILEADLQRVTHDTQELLSNLLIWIKSQMHYSEISLSHFQANTAFENSMRILKDLAKAKSIVLDYTITDDAWIFADRTMFDVIMRNLVNNALKFTPAGGCITVSARPQSGYYLFSVADNGIGIDADLKQDIFSLNIQSTYGTKNEKGAGLGLALCKEFTDAQNGSIWFENNQPAGSVFYLRLPVI